MRIENNKVNELLQSQGTLLQQPGSPASSGVDFASVLQDQLKLSGHAKTRLESRNIELDSSQWNRVLDGVNRAAAKGAKDSLVMVDGAALVVSVKNRTVITAVDQANLKENVFTNIDSAVIV